MFDYVSYLIFVIPVDKVFFLLIMLLHYLHYIKSYFKLIYIYVTKGLSGGIRARVINFG